MLALVISLQGSEGVVWGGRQDLAQDVDHDVAGSDGGIVLNKAAHDLVW